MPGLQAASVAGQVLVPKCDNCGQAHWYPKADCPFCRGSWTWSAVDGSGTIFTYSIVRRAFRPDLVDRVPFAVGTVSLTAFPNVRLVANIVGSDFDDIKVGMPVVPVDYIDGNSETARVCYRRL